MQYKWSIILFCALFMMTPASTYAASKKTQALSQRVFNQLQKVNELIDAESYDDALTALDDILTKNLSSYERAQMWYVKGTVLFQQNLPNKAADAFEQVVTEPDKLPELLLQRTLRTIVQLRLSLDDMGAAKRFIPVLVENSTQPQIDHALIAQVYYKAQDYQRALEHINIVAQWFVNQQQTPTENALLLQNAIYYELQDLTSMLTVLEQLTEHYPKPSYLLYLASVHGQLGHQRQQTILMESLYEKALLTSPSQYISLASLYMAEKVPYKGAQLLQKAIEDSHIEANRRNLETLSQAWLMANEFDAAIEALQKAAALDEDGELYMRLAYLLYDRFRWQEAERALGQAIDKGFKEQNKLGAAYLLKAMLLFNMDNFDGALESCLLAQNYDSTQALATDWITYIQSEQQKRQQLLAR